MIERLAELKRQHPDSVLLCRIGDFYEAFGDDAETLAGVLNLTLSRRTVNGLSVALAGFPYHALNGYMLRLVKSGLRVAVCEQVT